MITPITYPTSLEYWLNCEDQIDSRVDYLQIATSDYYRLCTKKDTARDADIFHLNPPLHILFPNDRSRHAGKNFSCHVLSDKFPPDSYIKLTNYLYVICPELTFLLAAKEHSLSTLIKLGCDLCSIYKKDIFSTVEQTNRKQVVTVQDIRKYLGDVHCFPGISRARQALRYVLDCSNSPRESKLASLFRLPFSLGGAGIYDISLNNNISLTTQSAELLGYETCCCDIVYLHGKKVFEYDSNLTHLNPRQHARDKKRITALQMSGYSVFTITAENLKSHIDIDNLILSARTFLGLRTHMDRFMKYRNERWRVIDELFFTRNTV